MPKPRSLMTMLAATGLATALLAGAAAAQDKKVVISVYGFAQDEFKEILYDPFEKICGCDRVGHDAVCAALRTGKCILKGPNLFPRASFSGNQALHPRHDGINVGRGTAQ